MCNLEEMTFMRTLVVRGARKISYIGKTSDIFVVTPRLPRRCYYDNPQEAPQNFTHLDTSICRSCETKYVVSTGWTRDPLTKFNHLGSVGT